jgi:acyl dehydratase
MCKRSRPCTEPTRSRPQEAPSRAVLESSELTIHGLDELKTLVGREAGVSPWYVVSQDLISRFAELTGDTQWIHTNPERARAESPFGGTVAHGFLTLSLMSRLVREAVDLQGDFKMGVNYGFNRLRFPAPVPAGSRIRARVILNALQEAAGYLEIAWGVAIEIEDSARPALVAEWLLRKYY